MATVTANAVENVARGAWGGQWSEAWAGRGQRLAELGLGRDPSRRVDTARQLSGRRRYVRAGPGRLGTRRALLPISRGPAFDLRRVPPAQRDLSPVEWGAGYSAGYTEGAQ